jgi:hypothetical protein
MPTARQGARPPPQGFALGYPRPQESLPSPWKPHTKGKQAQGPGTLSLARPGSSSELDRSTG